MVNRLWKGIMEIYYEKENVYFFYFINKFSVDRTYRFAYDFDI